jgi:hypothetical protein
MGLYQYKCYEQPIWSDVYDIVERKIVVFHTLADLKPYKCDLNCKPTEEAVAAHNAYYESKRWLAHGVYDENGIVRDNRCIHFNSARELLPSPDEPGNNQAIILILYMKLLTYNVFIHRLSTLP